MNLAMGSVYRLLAAAAPDMVTAQSFGGVVRLFRGGAGFAASSASFFLAWK
jgi:hypothetical protein